MNKALILALLMSGSACAQSLPDKPTPHVTVTLRDDATRRIFKQQIAIPHRTADRSWWLAMAGSTLLTVADVENTVYCLHSGVCVEDNPLYGRDPSRLRLWSLSGPTLAATGYLSWREKRAEDAEKAFGVKLSRVRWYWLPIVNGASHLFGVAYTLRNTGK
jgi:hypothetical protein